MGDMKAEMQSFIMYNNSVLKRSKEAAPFRNISKVEKCVLSFTFNAENFDIVMDQGLSGVSEVQAEVEVESDYDDPFDGDFDEGDMIESATDLLQDEGLPFTNQTEVDVESLLVSENVSDEEIDVTNGDYGPEIVGRRVTIFWSTENMYFNGKIASYNSRRKAHRIEYDDGEVQELHLFEERFDFL